MGPPATVVAAAKQPATEASPIGDCGARVSETSSSFALGWIRGPAIGGVAKELLIRFAVRLGRRRSGEEVARRFIGSLGRSGLLGRRRDRSPVLRARFVLRPLEGRVDVQLPFRGRRIAGRIGDRSADRDVSAGRHRPGRLAAGLRHDADLLPFGRIGLSVFEPQLGRVQMVVGSRPAKLDFSRFEFRQQKLQHGRGRIDDHFQARLDVVALRMESIESVESADREPILAVGRRQIVEVIGPRLRLVDHPPPRALIGRNVELHLACIDPLHLGRVRPERDAKPHLVGEDGIRARVAC